MKVSTLSPYFALKPRVWCKSWPACALKALTKGCWTTSPRRWRSIPRARATKNSHKIPQLPSPPSKVPLRAINSGHWIKKLSRRIRNCPSKTSFCWLSTTWERKNEKKSGSTFSCRSAKECATRPESWATWFKPSTLFRTNGSVYLSKKTCLSSRTPQPSIKFCEITWGSPRRTSCSISRSVKGTSTNKLKSFEHRLSLPRASETC